VSATTRRALLAGAGLAAIGAAAGATPARAGVSQPAALQALIAREDAAVAAYELAAAATGDALLERIARQDGQHAHVLRVQLEALTIPPGRRPAGAELRDPFAAALAGAAPARAAIAAAIALEEDLLPAYLAAARQLVDARLLQAVATILGSHAQQLAALRGAAGLPLLDEPVLNTP
jgi:rubrerythrin